jgi:capsular exopolysaccharide synthesis family protein
LRVSRIDEALRRRGRREELRASARATTDVFVPAWDLASGQRQLPPADEDLGVSHESLFPQPHSQTVLGLNNKWGERLVSSSQCDPAFVEQFRRLAAVLHNAQQGNRIRAILVTSASPNEGKTLTAINLALVLSESYRRRVLLIDADLRHPSIGDAVEGLGVSGGLSAVLNGKHDQKLPLVTLTPMLTLLPAGAPDPDPLGGLTSQRMRRILDEAMARFDWVILDGPPTGLIADSSLLAQMVDGTLFVVRAGETQYASIQKAIETIGRERVLGVVLNGAAAGVSEQYAPYYGNTSAIVKTG